jgi:pyridoxamine 5'-phosphate oxidase
VTIVPFGTDLPDETGLDAEEPDPIRLMHSWLPPNDSWPRPLMSLSTVDVDGYPDARNVLLSEVDAGGLYFHTDSDSRKARQLAATARACAVLVWPDAGRQLTVQGDVELAAPAESSSIYATRGRYLRLLAWVNTVELAQLPLAERRRRWAEFAAEHPDPSLGPAPTWLGFRLRATRLAFYRADEHGPSHRTEYRRDGDTWLITKLPG